MSYPNQHIQALNLPLPLSQQPLHPLKLLPIPHLPDPTPHPLHRIPRNRLRRLIRRLHQHARRLDHCVVERQLRGVGRERRVEPRRVEVEERDDEDEEEERAVYARPVEEVCRGDEEDEIDG
jgi:hypothetical protein